MDLTPIPRRRFSAVAKLAEATESLDRRCVTLLSQIKAEIQAESLMGKSCDLAIETSGRVLATFSSPVGEGRFVRTWDVSGDYLAANLVFERKVFDNFDREVWEPLFAIRVPRYDDAVIGSGSDEMRFSLDFPDSDRMAPANTFVAMLFGLIEGPGKRSSGPQ